VLAGDVVLKRSIYRGNVRWTFPHRYVGRWGGRVGLYCGPGNQGKAMRRGPDGYLERWGTEQLSWYVNLQTPTVVRDDRVDTTDQALDIVVSPSGEWRWKDEDELDEAVELGIWTEREAAVIRAEGERVLEARPWPTGWESWRPPEAWGPLGLPRDWHVV